MKILMLCDFYHESLEYQEQLCAKFYVRQGHTVTVVTSTHESVFDYMADRHDNRRPAKTYEHGGVTIVRLPYRYNILHRLKAFTRIDSLLESEAPDLIFVHDIMLNFPECVRYLQRHPRYVDGAAAGNAAPPLLLTTGDPSAVSAAARIFWPDAPPFRHLAV